MIDLNNEFQIIAIIALADAIIGGTVMSWLQRIGWKQKINTIYQLIMFVICGTLLVIFCKIEIAAQVALLWLCFVPDILFYWFLPPLRPLHIVLTGRVPTFGSAGRPIPMFYIRPTYRSALGFVFQRNFSDYEVCLMSIVCSLLIYSI